MFHYYNQYCVEHPCTHIFVMLINFNKVQKRDSRFQSQRFYTYLRLSYILPNSLPEKSCLYPHSSSSKNVQLPKPQPMILFLRELHLSSIFHSLVPSLLLGQTFQCLSKTIMSCRVSSFLDLISLQYGLINYCQPGTCSIDSSVLDLLRLNILIDDLEESMKSSLADSVQHLFSAYQMPGVMSCSQDINTDELSSQPWRSSWNHPGGEVYDVARPSDFQNGTCGK